MKNRIPKINNTELKIVASAGAVHYGNGYFFKPIKLDHFSAASTKTLTFDLRRGNFRWHKPWETIKPINDRGEVDYFNYTGFANAVGLSNVGLPGWMREYYPLIKTPQKIIISLASGKLEELLKMVDMTNPLDALAVEPNLTCPNDGACMDNWMVDDEAFIEAIQNIQSNSLHPVVLKLSAQQDYLEIAKRLKDIIAAVSINSVPWNIAFPGKASPLAKFGGGGVSGKTARRITWPMAFSISEIVDVPVIVPGIWNQSDIKVIKDMDRWNLVPSVGSSSIPPPFTKALKIIKKAIRPQ